jgi:hypothetical protein
MKVDWKTNQALDRCDCVTTKATRCANVADHEIRTDRGSRAVLCHTHYRRWVNDQFLVIGTRKGAEAA